MPALTHDGIPTRDLARITATEFVVAALEAIGAAKAAVPLTTLRPDDLYAMVCAHNSNNSGVVPSSIPKVALLGDGAKFASPQHILSPDLLP